MALLAQVDTVLLRAPLDAPGMSGFAAAFDPVYRLAEQTPGFVWRLRDETDRAPVVEGPDGLRMVNVSLWRSYEALHGFVYRSVHGALLQRRARWCLPQQIPVTCLWWVGDDARPDVEQALQRLAVLRREGPGPRAFSVRRRFDARGLPERPRRPPAG